MEVHSHQRCHPKVAIPEIIKSKLEGKANPHKVVTNFRDITLWIYLMSNMGICREMKLLMGKKLKKKDKIILEYKGKLNKIKVAY